ncbi:hypothetical protein HK100_009675 [Physocladia obscura]|uniref:Chromatin modification-related protein EAF6 n=1 Tax=Physocladia obscura TaxID=109957 RepID=A0AAD5T482_9FUNG|nr:hypothetical protein HK100_009675 [Physocladia obscura]
MNEPNQDTVATTTTATQSTSANLTTVQPNTVNTANGTVLDSQKLEKLSQVERELADLMAKKKTLDRQLVAIEANIYSYEGSYLDDPNGNIVKGYDGYINAVNRSVDSKGHARKFKIQESDRIFSQSSVTYQKSLHNS